MNLKIDKNEYIYSDADQISSEVFKLAENSLAGLKNNLEIKDLTYLRTYTIDNNSTFEVDDAISLEVVNGEYVVWIHIADPSSLIPMDSKLDLEARKRATSIYLVDNILPMLPHKLIDEFISLNPGRKSSALSAAVRLNETGDIVGSSIMRSWIQPTYRLNYQDADELIEYAPPQDKDLLILSDLLEIRKSWRKKQGAICLEQSYGKLTVIDKIPQLEIVEPSKSRRLVTECMILMGSVVGHYGTLNNIPLPYRYQPESKKLSDDFLKQISVLAVRNSAIKQSLSKAATSTSPKPHSSLGLKSYVQITSPMRRYSDLLAHRQLIAYLSNQKLLSADSLRDLMKTIEASQKQANEIMNENKRDWLTLWFQNNLLNIWSVYFLRWLKTNENLALLYFEALEIELVCHIKYDNTVEFGQAYSAHINSIDIGSNSLEFSLI